MGRPVLVASVFLASVFTLQACSDDEGSADEGTAARIGQGGAAGTAGASGSNQVSGAGGFDCSQLEMGAPGMGAPGMGAGMGPDISCISTNCNDPCSQLLKTLSSFGTGNPMGGGAGAAGAPSSPGNKVYQDRSCSSCHGPSGEGSQGPNITPSTSAGTGSWTAAQLKTAIRDGKDKDGKDLCSSMPRWEVTQLTDSALEDLVHFLQKEIPAVDLPNPGTLCAEGAGGSTGGPPGGPPGGFDLDISPECFSCLDARCPDIAAPLRCLGGM